MTFPKEPTLKEMIHQLRNPVGKRSLAELDDVIDEIIDRNPDFVEKINKIISRKIMRNRYGVEYRFEKVGKNTYTIRGALEYWRYGGQEGQDRIDYHNLEFVDPSGGPFISIGYLIDERKVVRISMVEDQLHFEVE
jgi:hypothetical protein